VIKIGQKITIVKWLSLKRSKFSFFFTKRLKLQHSKLKGQKVYFGLRYTTRIISIAHSTAFLSLGMARHLSKVAGKLDFMEQSPRHCATCNFHDFLRKKR